MIKLGKAPALFDKRTLKLKTILKPKLPAPPKTYDADAILGVVDRRMYLNDTYGDCVVAGSAHAINRFEMFESKSLPDIPDTDVEKQYFKETGGTDDGLVLLTHLNRWREAGLNFGGKVYQIHAFASVNWKNHTEVMQAISLLNGVYLGMLVPAYFMAGFENGKRTFDVQCRNGKIEGGHCIYSPAYIKQSNTIGPVVVTWGERVQFTWKFWDKYVDECFALVDEKDSWLDSASPLNVPLLESYLNNL